MLHAELFLFSESVHLRVHLPEGGGEGGGVRERCLGVVRAPSRCPAGCELRPECRQLGVPRGSPSDGLSVCDCVCRSGALHLGQPKDITWQSATVDVTALAWRHQKNPECLVMNAHFWTRTTASWSKRFGDCAERT